jgi:hypothetical protein
LDDEYADVPIDVSLQCSENDIPEVNGDPEKQKSPRLSTDAGTAIAQRQHWRKDSFPIRFSVAGSSNITLQTRDRSKQRNATERTDRGIVRCVSEYLANVSTANLDNFPLLQTQLPLETYSP